MYSWYSNLHLHHDTRYVIPIRPVPSSEIIKTSALVVLITYYLLLITYEKLTLSPKRLMYCDI